MMIAAKPAFTVLVAATVSLTVAGPLPLCLLVLLTAGLLLVLPTLFLVLLSPGLLLLALGLSLLILICGLRLLLLFLLLLLLALGLLLLVLIGRLGLLLLLFLLLLLLTLSLLLLMLSLLLLSVLLLLLFRLGLLLLFRSLGLLLVLILLCIRGGDCSKKKDQNSRADETGAFHVCCLRCNIPCGPLLVAPGAAVFQIPEFVVHGYFPNSVYSLPGYDLPFAPTTSRTTPPTNASPPTIGGRGICSWVSAVR